MPIITPYKRLTPFGQKSSGASLIATFGTPSVTAQALEVLTIDWPFTPVDDVTLWTMTLRDADTSSVLGIAFGGPATGGVEQIVTITGVDAIDGIRARNIIADLLLDLNPVISSTAFTPFQILPTHHTAGTGSITPRVTMSTGTAIFTINSGVLWNSSGTSVSPGGVAEIIFALPAWGGAQISAIEMRDCLLTSIDDGWEAVDTSAMTSLANGYRDNDLTNFPWMDTSAVTDFSFCWFNNKLESFPSIDTSAATNIASTWRTNNLPSFPSLNYSLVVNAGSSWRDNVLESFPQSSFPLATNLNNAWNGNNLETFPQCDFTSCTALILTFVDNALDDIGTNNILASLVAGGLSGGRVDITGGTNAAPTGQGITDKTTLQSRSWIVNTA